MEPRIPGTAGAGRSGTNDYVRKLADAADAKGLEIVAIDGDSPPWTIELQNRRPLLAARSFTELRLTLRGIRILEGLEALPSFRTEEGS